MTTSDNIEDGEYIFVKNAVGVNWSSDLEHYQYFSAVLVNREGEYYPLKERRDLFSYTGNYSWGYRGTGVRFLAHSIYGDLYGDDLQLDRINRIIDILSEIDGNTHIQRADFLIS